MPSVHDGIVHDSDFRTELGQDIKVEASLIIQKTAASLKDSWT